MKKNSFFYVFSSTFDLNLFNLKKIEKKLNNLFKKKKRIGMEIITNDKTYIHNNKKVLCVY